MTDPEITVVIAAIPTRRHQLQQAIDSVLAQTYPAIDINIAIDYKREGAAINRNRAANRVETEWMAFLDDDDFLLPQHLDTLVRAQKESGADVVWPWFRVVGGTDPFPHHKGKQWDYATPHQIPITALVRTEAFRTVGGFETIPEGTADADGNRIGEDLKLWIDLSGHGYKFHHVDEITWIWNHHGNNTSGLASRW